MATCMIGMSGGVDSSVAALRLMEAGYECIGVTMKLYSGSEEGTCCSLSDVEDAKSVCARLGIPHYTLNFTREFERDVMGPFAASYEAGLTPNPCIDCNRHLKFQAMWQRARELGCDFVATGHYARIAAAGDALRLKKAADAEKDQTYVLYFLSQEQLRHTLFPLGELTKAQVREIAAAHGFVNAQKQDSQDICFVPDGDYGAFLERFTGKRYESGVFIDRDGKIAALCDGQGHEKKHGDPGQQRGTVLLRTDGGPSYPAGGDPCGGTGSPGEDPLPADGTALPGVPDG